MHSGLKDTKYNWSPDVLHKALGLVRDYKGPEEVYKLQLVSE